MSNIKDALSQLSRRDSAEWITDPTQWDESIKALCQVGPIMIGLIGLTVVSVGMGGSSAVEIHSHDDAAEARECYGRGAQMVREGAIIVMEDSTAVTADEEPTVSLDRPALPVGSDEPTARTFGWV
jgi:hypothetical protein